MSSTAATSRARQGFLVGRRRYVPVVDGGCGCRPRGRPRLLTSLLPSFLKPSSFGCTQLGGGGVKHATAVRRRSGGGGEKYSSTSSSAFTTASSFASSSCAAATHSTGGYSSSAYSDYSYGVAVPSVATTKKPPPPQQHKQQPAVIPHNHHKAKKKKKEPATPPTVSSSSKKASVKKKKKSGGSRMMAEAEEDGGVGVGVAVEKESCDPRADFRDSMVAMVVEMGLCDWDGLRCMLRRLLALNAPRHHAAILAAFAEVCAQIVAAPAAAGAPSAVHHSPSPPAYHYRR